MKRRFHITFREIHQYLYSIVFTLYYSLKSHRKSVVVCCRMDSDMYFNDFNNVDLQKAWGSRWVMSLIGLSCIKRIILYRHSTKYIQNMQNPSISFYVSFSFHRPDNAEAMYDTRHVHQV